MNFVHSYNRSYKSSSAAERSDDELVIGLCIPLSGSSGLWGPSALAAAKLAVEELNSTSGIGGFLCRLEIVNASEDSTEIEARLTMLVESNAVDVIVGTHISSVRDRILKVTGGRIPYVYTTMYEGGELRPGIFAIGETPVQQLRPAIDWLSKKEGPKRWLLLGNDYVWPHVSNQQAKKYISESSGQVIDEIYLPLGTTDFSNVCERIRTANADTILLSLVGQDSIEFNRTFGDLQLWRKVKRLSCSIEENELLGIGAANTENLFVASTYFDALNTDANLSFKERYSARFGKRAPILNSHGQSTYEGIHFLAALSQEARKDPDAWKRAGKIPVPYCSARDAQYTGNTQKCAPMYLARASGHVFDVVTRL
jgi:urea transport system substrate-binding protein